MFRTYHTLFLTNSFLPTKGGVEIGLHLLLKEVSTHTNTRPIVISFDAPLRIKFSDDYVHLGLTRLGFMFPLAFIIICCCRIFAHNAYVIQLFPTGFRLITLLKLLRFRSIVFRSAGGDIQEKVDINYGHIRKYPAHRIEKFINRINSEQVRLVSVSQSITNKLVTLGIHEKLIYSLFNGINYKKVSKFSKNIQKINAVSCVARNHPKKRLDQFITLANLCPTLDFILVTDKPLLIDVPTNCEVIYDNSKNDIDLPSDVLVKSICKTKVFFLPSSVEAFGNVFMEAAAAGNIVTGYDVPGVRDTLPLIKNSVLFQEGRLEDIALRIHSLVENYDSIKDIDDMARDIELYSWEKFYFEARKLDLL